METYRVFKRRTEQAKKFAAECGLTMTAQFVPWSQSRNKGDKYPSLNWLLTLTNGVHTLTLDYMQGCAHLPHYEHRFAHYVVYADVVREACETGKSRLQSGKRNAYDACGADRLVFRIAKVEPPALADVLYCLVSDASVLDYGAFEEWAREFGYDEDSRTAEKTYRQCLEHALKLRQMLDLDAAREAFQDY